jgi:ankyrin repeat protein
MNKTLTLEEILQTTSDRLFPAEMGEQYVAIDSVDCDGDTPLHVFIGGEETANALLLIQHGADVNAIGDMGLTPLHVAISHKNMAVVDALLKAGARTDIISEFGDSPASQAEKMGVQLNIAI